MPEPHALRTFLDSVVAEMATEYKRIYDRSIEDPGTAGDEGEANWKDLLSDWLPSDVYVTMKGRILGWNGQASPQIDVVVLAGDYPRKLREKKVYLAGGVIAAFECKNTLRSAHVTKFFDTAAKISEISKNVREGNCYDEVFSPIIYGLLAHAHEWRDNDQATAKIDQLIRKLHEMSPHPRQLPNVVCVSNLRTWHRSHGGPRPVDWDGIDGGPIDPQRLNAGEYDVVSYFSRWIDVNEFWGIDADNYPPANPIGELILHLLRHFAIIDPKRDGLPNYFASALRDARGTVSARRWGARDVHSPMLLKMMGSGTWNIFDGHDAKNRHHLP